jgi:hypothetical protein
LCRVFDSLPAHHKPNGENEFAPTQRQASCWVVDVLSVVHQQFERARVLLKVRIGLAGHRAPPGKENTQRKRFAVEIEL